MKPGQKLMALYAWQAGEARRALDELDALGFRLSSARARLADVASGDAGARAERLARRIAIAANAAERELLRSRDEIAEEAAAAEASLDVARGI